MQLLREWIRRRINLETSPPDHGAEGLLHVHEDTAIDGGVERRRQPVVADDGLESIREQPRKRCIPRPRRLRLGTIQTRLERPPEDLSFS